MVEYKVSRYYLAAVLVLFGHPISAAEKPQSEPTIPISTELEYSAEDVTKDTLTDCHDLLAAMKKFCGRYPTTQEGLQSLVVQPYSLHCRDYKKVENSKGPFSPGPEDTWGCVRQSKELRYVSGASGYRIDGPLGFFVTGQSPKQPDDRYWERHTPK